MQSDRSGPPYSVLLIDDEPEYLAALAEVVDREPRLVLAGAAHGATEAIALARDLEPDVALVDVRMAGAGGPEVARGLRDACTSTKVIALSAHGDRQMVAEMLQAGAARYLLKGGDVDTLTEAIISVAAGSDVPAPMLDGVDDTGAQRIGKGRTGRIRVLLVDPDLITVDALHARGDGDPEFEVVGTATDHDEALRLSAQCQPDVALVDSRLAGYGAAVVAAISRHSPATRSLVISSHCEPERVTAILRAGASGFLLKPVQRQALLDALCALASGRVLLAPEMVGPVLEELILDAQRGERDRSDDVAARARVEAAITGSALRIVFQPIYALDDRQPVAVEALARFRAQPRRVAHAWFQEAARCGRIVELDSAAMHKSLEALSWLPDWIDLHVNVAPETLLAGRGLELLQASRPQQIVVEITEHSEVTDYRRLRQALAPLREGGIRIAVDDVGAGYSSLRHVLVLEPHVIKLDVSLCRGIDTKPTRRALARALTTFCHEVGTTVVAEGVETAAELEVLRELGVTHAQGYLLARPADQPLPLLGAKRSIDRRGG